MRLSPDRIAASPHGDWGEAIRQRAERIQFVALVEARRHRRIEIVGLQTAPGQI
jgi:hypothetical protein